MTSTARPVSGAASHMLTYPVYAHLEHLGQVGIPMVQMLRFPVGFTEGEHLARSQSFRANRSHMLKMLQMLT